MGETKLARRIGAAHRAQRWRRWGRRALVALGVLVVLALGAGVWAATEAEGWVTERVREAAAQRGWSVRWEALEVTSAPGVVVRGGVATHAGGEVAFERLEAMWTWDAVAAQRRRPDRVVVSGFRLEGGPELLDAVRGAGAGKPRKDGADHASSGGEGWSKTEVTVQQGSVRVATGVEALPRVELDALSLHSGWEPGQGWVLRGEGRCVVGCGEERVEVAGSVRRDEARRHTAEATFRPALSVPVKVRGASSPLCDAAAALAERGVVVQEGCPDVSGHVQVRALTVEQVEAGAWAARVDARDVQALARWGSWAVRGLVARVSAGWDASDPLRLPEEVALERPELTVLDAPKDDPFTAQARALMERLRGDASAPNQKASDSAPDDEDAAPKAKRDTGVDVAAWDVWRERVPGLLKSVEGWGARLRPWVERAQVRDGALRWPARAFEVTDIDSTRGDGERVVLGTWEGLRGGVALRDAAPHVAAVWEGVPLERLKALSPRLRAKLEAVPQLEGLDGRLSGRLMLEAITAAPPDPRMAPARLPEHGEAQDADEAEAAKTKAKREGKAEKPSPRLGPMARRHRDDRPRDALRGVGHLIVEDGVLDVAGLAPGPIRQARQQLDWAMVLWWPRGHDGVAVEAERLTWTLPSRHRAEPVTLEARAKLRHLGSARLKPRVALEVWSPEDDCHAAIGAIPAGMIPHLAPNLEATGRFAPRLTFSVDMEDLYTTALDVTGLPGTCTLTRMGPYDPAFLAEDFTHEVREGTTREGIVVGPGSPVYVPITALPNHLQVAMYVTEEPHFYRNKGFDLRRTTGAIRLNLKHGRYVYGGSTITQQLVKNLFLTRQRTLSRKLEEAFIVWKIEELLTKRRILELYMNCIEFGPNLYGIGRASWFYFGKPATRLTLLESAFLASLKPKPSVGIGPRSRGRTPSVGFWPERLHGILDHMKRRGYLSAGRVLSNAPYIVYFKNWRGPREP